jgi:hypothetical protein
MVCCRHTTRIPRAGSRSCTPIRGPACAFGVAWDVGMVDRCRRRAPSHTALGTFRRECVRCRVRHRVRSWGHRPARADRSRFRGRLETSEMACECRSASFARREGIDACGRRWGRCSDRDCCQCLRGCSSRAALRELGGRGEATCAGNLDQRLPRVVVHVRHALDGITRLGACVLGRPIEHADSFLHRGGNGACVRVRQRPGVQKQSRSADCDRFPVPVRGRCVGQLGCGSRSDVGGTLVSRPLAEGQGSTSRRMMTRSRSRPVPTTRIRSRSAASCLAPSVRC